MTQRLFKYKAVSSFYDNEGNQINRDIENLLLEQLWVSSLEGMNDPLECAFHVDQSLGLDNILQFQRNLQRSYACVSFSTSVRCRRLWNYYTDGMRGMVIEYSDSSIRKALRNDHISPIKYNGERGLATCLKGHVKSGNIVELSPDGRLLFIVSNDITIQLWDIETRALLHSFTGHTEPVSTIAVGSDGTRLVSASYDNTIRVWDIDRGTVEYTLEGHTGPVSSVAISPDGTRLVSASYDNTIRVWDIDRGTVEYTLEGHTGPVSSVAISPDGTRLVSASYDNTIRVWNIDRGIVEYTLEGHTDWVYLVAFLHTSGMLVSASYDNSIRIWDLLSGDCLHVVEESNTVIDSIAAFSDGTRIVYILSDGTVYYLNAITFERRPIFSTSGKKGTEESLKKKAKKSIKQEEKIAYEGKVIYDGKKTDLTNQYGDFIEKQTDNISINVDMLFHKDNSWENEKEYRFAFSYKYLLNHRLSGVRPTAIYLGYRMPKENSEKILQYCKDNGISLYMYTPSFHSKSSKQYNRTTIFEPRKKDKV